MTSELAGRRLVLASCASSLFLALGIPGPVASAAAPLGGWAALLRQGEAALSRGDGIAAIEAFERAASMQHEPNAELGLVRAYMQTGAYRQALAFCAHVAGAHLDAPAAAALYAWLLRAGAQEAVGRRVLAATLSRSPGEPVVVAAALAFAAGQQRATGALLETPHRMAPAAFVGKAGTAPSEGSRIFSTGVLVSGGTKALVPAKAVFTSAAPGESPIWVRNGLGHVSLASVDGGGQPLRHLGVAVLALDDPLDSKGFDVWTTREPFAGSAGYLVEHAEAADAAPAWPWMRQGFVGAAATGTVLRQLGIEVASGRHGGPVLDASGRLVGIALDDGAGRPVWLPAPHWQLSGSDPERASAGTGHASLPAPRAAPDEVYERALRLTLQVIVPS